MDSDGFVERFQAAMRKVEQRYADEEIGRMEGLLAATPTHESGCPPMPGECHPYYQGHKWLTDWLNGSSTYPWNCVRLPKPRLLRLMPLSDLAEVGGPQHFTLTKQHAAWPAPYVGRPFVYAWHFASDELGRSIAGESRIAYMPGYGNTPREEQ